MVSFNGECKHDNSNPGAPAGAPITAEDNPAIAHVIREVSAEHGLTADKGYTVSDPNLDALYQLYSLPRSTG